MTVDRSVTIRLRVSSAEFDAAMARAGAEVRLLRAEVEGAGRGAGGAGGGFDDLGKRASKAGDDGKKSINGLALAVIGLGPALIPIAAIGVPVLGAVAGGAVSAGLAFKGAGNEIKNNTVLGQQWAASLNPLKADLTTLETTASRAFIGGFSSAAADAEARMPALTGQVQRLGTETADVAKHGISAMFGAFTALDPLIEKLLGDLDSGAIKLDKWANGGGLNKFVTWGEQNLPMIEKDLGEIVTVIAQVLAAGAGQGLTILNTLGSLSHVASDLMPELKPLLPVITDIYLAIKLYESLGPAIVALKGFAVAEEAAAAGGASGGLLGRSQAMAGSVAGVTARLVPYAAAWIGATLALSTASHATDQWTYSNNIAERGAARLTQAFSDLGHLNLAGFGNELLGGGGSRQAQYNSYIADYNNFVGAMDKINGEHAANTANAAKNVGPIAPQFMAPTVATPNASAFDTSRAKEYAAEVNELGKAYTYLQQQMGSTPISQAAESYNKLQTSIQTNVDASDKFLKLGGPTIETYHGIAIGQNTLDAALKLTNGDYSAAIGLIHGNVDAIGQNRDVINDLIVRQQRLGTFQSDMTTKYKLTTDQVDLYSMALGLSADAITRSGASEKQAEQDLGGFVKQLSNGSTAMNGWVAAIAAYNQAGDTAASRGALIGEALRAANGDAIAYQNTMVQVAVADQQLVTDFKNVKAGVVDWKTGVIDFHNAAAAPLLGDLQSMQDGAVKAAAATYQHETAMHKASAGADAMALYIADTKTALEDQFVQLGKTRPEADKLAATYFSIKNEGDLKKEIDLIANDKVTVALSGILEDLDQLSGLHHASLLLDAATTPEADKVISLLGGPSAQKLKMVSQIGGPPYADGGQFLGAGGPREDANMIRISNKEYVVNADATARNLPLLDAINSGARGFAIGGFTGVDYSGGSAGKAAASKATSLATLRMTIDDTDIPKFLHALSGTAAQIQAAETTLANASAKAGGGTRLSALLAADNKQLEIEAAARAAIAVKLTAANTKLSDAITLRNTERTKIAGAVTGAFDITTAGQSSFGTSTAGSILAAAQQDATNAALFKRQIDQLQGLGLDKNEVEALAAKGFSGAEANVLALTGASKSQISLINASVKQLGATGAGLGVDVAGPLYQAGVNAAQGIVNGLKSQEAALDKQMTHLADVMVNAVKSKLGIHSPSAVGRELGGFFGQGIALGISDHHTTVSAAAGRVAAAAYAGALPVGRQAPAIDAGAIADAVAKAIARTPFQLKDAVLRARGGDFEAVLAERAAGRV